MKIRRYCVVVLGQSAGPSIRREFWTLLGALYFLHRHVASNAYLYKWRGDCWCEWSTGRMREEQA